MTWLQTCQHATDARVVTKRPKGGLKRSFVQSFADLRVAILYSGLAGFAVLAIDASDGGGPTATTWVLCCVVPPVATLLLIGLDAIVRHSAERKSAR